MHSLKGKTSRRARAKRYAILGVAINGLTACTADAGYSYSILDLGTLGGFSSYAEGYGTVNGSGQVVGVSRAAGGEWRAFRTPANRSITGTSDLGTLGGWNSFAMSINDSGQVTGYADTTGNAAQHAFRTAVDGGMSDLGTLGGKDSFGYGINNLGQVVGFSYLSDNRSQRAFRTSADGRMINLGTLGGTSLGTYSYAYDINDSGQVVGYSTTAALGEDHAFRTSADGSMSDLGTLGGSLSWAYGINNAGQVIGGSYIGGGGQDVHAFRTSANGNITAASSLGTLGGTWAEAFAINDLGQVVGSSYTDGFTGEHAFFADATGPMIDLSKLVAGSGWVLTRATGINDRGQISGYGRVDGAARAFLMDLKVTSGWIDPAGGAFADGGNWDVRKVPTGTDAVAFDIDSSYTVQFGQAEQAASADVNAGTVRFALGGHTFTTEKVAIASGANLVLDTGVLSTGTLEVAGGLGLENGFVNAQSVKIPFGGAVVGAGELNGDVDSAGTIRATGALRIGKGDSATGVAIRGGLEVGAQTVTLLDAGAPELHGTTMLAGGTLEVVTTVVSEPQPIDLGVAGVLEGFGTIVRHVSGGAASIIKPTGGELKIDFDVSLAVNVGTLHVPNGGTLTVDSDFGIIASADVVEMSGGTVKFDSFGTNRLHAFNLTGHGKVRDAEVSIRDLTEPRGTLTIEGSFIASREVRIGAGDTLDVFGYMYVPAGQAVNLQGGRLALNRPLDVSGGTIGGTGVVAGDVEMIEGSRIAVGTGTLRIEGSATGTGDIHLDGGTLEVTNGLNIWGKLTGTGMVDTATFSLAGDLSPGNSPGTLTLSGDLSLSESSRIILEIAGDGSGESDLLRVNGSLSGGSVVVSFTDGFAPMAGQTFSLLSVGGTTDPLGVTIQGLADGFQYRWGAAGPAGAFALTAINDGVSTVPEPSVFALLGTTALTLLQRRTRRR